MTNWKSFASMVGSVSMAALILGAGLAGAQTVDLDGTVALGIQTLDIEGTAYDVAFVRQTPNGVYGDYPGSFTFDTDSSANVAIEAINAALNNAGATLIRAGGIDDTVYFVGWEAFENPIGSIESCKYNTGRYTTTWAVGFGDATFWNTDPRPFAQFSLSVPVEGSSWSSIKSLYSN